VIFGMSAGVVALGLLFVGALVVFIFFRDAAAHFGTMVLYSFILCVGLLVLALMVISVTHFDVKPSLRKLAMRLADDRLVDFYTLVPDTYHVTDVQRKDTDGDGEDEWVVFYQFDLGDGRSPYAGVVYDNDRGDPPVLFPYHLTPPDRNYLSEEEVTLDLQDARMLSEPADNPARELVIYGMAGGVVTDLTVFRHVRNSFEWEPPRDDQPRYQAVGAFRGNGGVSLDPETRRVTVINRALDRSQLAVEAVYALDEIRSTYMSASDPKQLNSPISQRVTFAFGMPEDILDTPYPEKIVLGFYDLLGQSHPAVPQRDFLTGEALAEFDRGNMAYFGFGDAEGAVSDLKVTELQYATEVESLGPTASVTGQQPRQMIVSLTFDAWKGSTFVRTAHPVEWTTTWVDGKWRIDRHPASG
jgi:hypothetical protein